MAKLYDITIKFRNGEYYPMTFKSAKLFKEDTGVGLLTVVDPKTTIEHSFPFTAISSYSKMYVSDSYD